MFALACCAVDIDRDGVPDFSVWSGMAEAVASTDTFWKAVFGM